MGRGFQIPSLGGKIFFSLTNFWRWRNFHTWNPTHSEILYFRYCKKKILGILKNAIKTQHPHLQYYWPFRWQKNGLVLLNNFQIEFLILDHYKRHDSWLWNGVGTRHRYWLGNISWEVLEHWIISLLTIFM